VNEAKGSTSYNSSSSSNRSSNLEVEDTNTQVTFEVTTLSKGKLVKSSTIKWTALAQTYFLHLLLLLKITGTSKGKGSYKTLVLYILLLDIRRPLIKIAGLTIKKLRYKIKGIKTDYKV